MSDEPAASRYLEHLPAVMQESPFLGRFLLAFERLLRHSPDEALPALEDIVGRISTFFRPESAPEEFLPWLAGWVALTLREDWDVPTRRAFLRQIVPLYRRRGTLVGLRRMLELYLGGGEGAPSKDISILVEDDFPELPHFFQVQIEIRGSDTAVLRRKQQVALAIITQEKPAHTVFGLAVSLSEGQMRLPFVLGGEDSVLNTSRSQVNLPEEF